MKIVVFRVEEDGHMEDAFILPFNYKDRMTEKVATELLQEAAKKGVDWTSCEAKINGDGNFDLIGKGDGKHLGTMIVLEANMLLLPSIKLKRLLRENPDLINEINDSLDEELMG